MQPSNGFENGSAEGQNRTGDTRIFSPLLYLLSYLGKLVKLYTLACEKTNWQFFLLP